ncbi:HAD-IA family hydrolase [Pseudidiomarina taiwanensis]|uniref:HAD family hydrolase n=1 Tax=Pseudidiomarina taiwanensis TaxID=337250 RepID=A0A432ZNH7_9GAMM|nr:HAD-IA family hydrolase [Pseudidiomarina taiwanensis]RUO79418.1 HAD family hydrolase [Pseudidiomarina taiwanensis]
MRLKYALVVFDWDGTLMDSIGRIISSMQACARQLKLPVPSEQAVKDVIGLSLEPAIAGLFGRLTEQQHAAFLQAYKHEYVVANQTPTPLFNETLPLLHELRQAGATLAVATGKARPGLDRVLTEHCLEDYFAVTRCAGETRSKPDPQMLQEIMAHSGMTSAQTVLVGDSVHDLAMAANAGVASIGVTHGVHDRTRLARHNPIAIVDQLSELKSHIFAGES